jgi:glycosyltransferase involved in cell wall biosynthesis
MVQISGVIITFNEEQNIERCLDSISKVVDEIVVVDSFSKDQTKKICLDKGVRFIEHVFESHISQKNFALQQAKHDVVLSLDADEYLSDELTASILKVKEKWDNPVYRMNRLSMYGSKWIRHGNWYPDSKIRLWDRRLASWGGNIPHETVVLDKNVKVVKLQGDILHRSYRNSAESIVKIQSYSEIFARANAGKRSSSILTIVIHSSFAFFKSYVIKRGFLDGYEGLAVAVSAANHTFYKYAKLYEKTKRNN